MKTLISKADMLDRIKICQDLKTDAELARFLGISPATLSNWKSRDSIDYDLVFSKCESINLDWLLTGRGDMEKTDEPALADIRLIHRPKIPERIYEQQAVRLYDVSAAANLKTLFANKEQHILGEITIPNIPKCDGAVYVNGDSMYPLLKSGDIIAYKEIHSFDNIIYGEMYLISFALDGDEYLTVKYVNSSEKAHAIKLVSYNPHHNPMDIPVASINAMGLIKFSIRKNTMM